MRAARLERPNKRELVEQVGLEQLDALADGLEVLVGGLAADDAEHLVALLEQELGEQRAVLAADPRDERASGHGGEG